MDKSRVREIMLRGMSRSPLETERLNSWAMDRMAKEKEKRIQPYASSPSLKKDFTFNEEKKQKRIPKRSKASRTVGRKPEGEPTAILLEEPANASWGRMATTPQSKRHTLKKVFDSFFIVFKKFALIEPALRFGTTPLPTHIS